MATVLKYGQQQYVEVVLVQGASSWLRAQLRGFVGDRYVHSTFIDFDNNGVIKNVKMICPLTGIHADVPPTIFHQSDLEFFRACALEALTPINNISSTAFPGPNT